MTMRGHIVQSLNGMDSVWIIGRMVELETTDELEWETEKTCARCINDIYRYTWVTCFVLAGYFV